jgi:hypothetical protein
MAKTLKPALVGDPDPVRFQWLKNILDREYGLQAVQAKSFDEMQNLIEVSNEARELAEKGTDEAEEEEATNDWSLIFISDELPTRPIWQPTLESIKAHFTALDGLNKWLDFTTVRLKTRDKKIDWTGVIKPNATIAVPISPQPEESYGIESALDQLGGLERASIAESKIVLDEESRALREQVRSLSEWRDMKDGRKHLVGLIGRCIDCSKVERIEIKPLGQGKSGASVFRLTVEPKPVVGSKPTVEVEAERPEFVLKLCAAGAVWKLESEVSRHRRAEEGSRDGGYRVHMPRLRKAHSPSGGLENFARVEGANKYIVRSGQWYAVHYDFIGGDGFGEVLDLETILVAPAAVLERKTAGTSFSVQASKARSVRAVRADLLETVLQWLCENWYADSRTGRVRRADMPVWDISNAPEQEYIVMPPYKLTGRTKGWVLNFLDSQEAEMGSRFFDKWEEHRERVSRFVSADSPDVARLGMLSKPLTLTLSRVHGDLNANNVLVWLKHRHPLLIDFPFYQEAGHALQDFARLEVEIKFALLDRQKDSPEKRLQAFEYTYTQTRIWQEMEDRLLEQWDERVTRWSSKGYAGNVQLCFELLQMVRRRAREVQQNKECSGAVAGDFLTEYWPALLYHTVRAVGYSSLSIFKRLFAVYSASLILNELGCFTDSA